MNQLIQKLKKKIKRPLPALYFTQFLSAFADNMIFFIVLTLIVQGGLQPDEATNYMSIVQLAFLLAYVALAPFVGSFADRNPKSTILLIGNGFKGIGILMLLFGVNPITSYLMVGIGAVIYSPAKYGILPELTKNEKELHQANAKIEAFTILSIVFGGVAGSLIAASSPSNSMIVCLLLYCLSIGMTFLIPKMEGNKKISYKKAFKEFLSDFKKLLSVRKSRYSLAGTGSFWMTSSTVRIAFTAWIPLTLGIAADSPLVAGLVAITGVGIIFGSLLTPKFIPANKYYNTYILGFLLVVTLLLVNFASSIFFTGVILFLIGLLGGMYVVPMNTAIQEVGKKEVGNGRTIAIQNFVNNLMMILGILIYQGLTAGMNIPHHIAINGIAVALLLFVLYLVSHVSKLKKSR